MYASRLSLIFSLAAWSSGMILASGARGPGFNSRSSPCCGSELSRHNLSSETSHALPLPLGVKHVYGHLILGAQLLPPAQKVAGKSTARGFEPLRAEPNGFRVHLLNRSDTLSCRSVCKRFFSLSEGACGLLSSIRRAKNETPFLHVPARLPRARRW